LYRRGNDAHFPTVFDHHNTADIRRFSELVYSPHFECDFKERYVTKHIGRDNDIVVQLHED